MSHFRLLPWSGRLGALVFAAACAGPAAALTLQGAAYISPSTTIAPCTVAVCGGFGTNILEIADGDTSNFNGFAGDEGLLGIIDLDLLGNFDLSSFSLWNDINVLHEGVSTFQLHFYDAADALISTSAVFTAPDGQVAAGVYGFATVANVGRVELEVLSLLTGGVCCRIEIREVAFEGQAAAIPEPETYALMLAGLGLVGAAARRRKRATTAR